MVDAIKMKKIKVEIYFDIIQQKIADRSYIGG